MDLSEESGNIIGFSDDITILFLWVFFSQRHLVKALDLQPLAGGKRLERGALVDLGAPCHAAVRSARAAPE